MSTAINSILETCDQNARFDESAFKLYQIKVANVSLIWGIPTSNKILLQAF